MVVKDEINYNMPLATVPEIYELIVSDLKKAETMVPARAMREPKGTTKIPARALRPAVCVTFRAQSAACSVINGQLS